MRTKIGKRYVIVKLESYVGSDTFLYCGDEIQNFMYAIVVITPEDRGEIVDSSYRSFEEAAEAWPEAIPDAARAE